MERGGARDESDDSSAGAGKIILVACGGRNYKDYGAVSFGFDLFTYVIGRPHLLVHGDARGADRLAGRAARERGIPVRRFPAEWKDLTKPDAIVKKGKWGYYDAYAGIRRNKQMAAIGTHLLAFPGGRGTENMIRTARENGLWIMTVGEL